MQDVHLSYYPAKDDILCVSLSEVVMAVRCSITIPSVVVAVGKLRGQGTQRQMSKVRLKH